MPNDLAAAKMRLWRWALKYSSFWAGMIHLAFSSQLRLKIARALRPL